MNERPLFIRGLVIAICGTALAAGGCLGAFSFGNGFFGGLGVVVAIAGLLGFLAGVLVALVAAVEWLFRLIAGTRG